MMPSNLQLIPEEDQAKATRLFESDQEYQAFCQSLQEQVKAELDRQRDARLQSEEQAKQHLIF